MNLIYRKDRLVFGNEHSGVSEDILPLTDGNFIIPAGRDDKSLNISVGLRCTLYEAFRQKKMAGHYNQRN
ncbi:MAG: TrmH family RNA methyltransferase [Bacteroidota bacterium]